MRDRQNLFKRYWDYLGGINGLALVIYSFIVIGIDVFFSDNRYRSLDNNKE